MPENNLSVLLVICGILLAPCGKLRAQVTWYVATNGNDTANRSTNGWEDAYLTINKAVAESASGDTVLVGAGEYFDCRHFQCQ